MSLFDKFKPKKLKPYLVFADISPEGYFQVGVVYANNEDEAVNIVRDVAGQPFVDGYGLFLALYPDTPLTVELIEPERGPLIGYSNPRTCI